MAATSKLIIYNDALRELGGHPLADLTTVNTRLTELDGAFPHAVEYMLTRADWNFARRRTTLAGTADTSYPPYTKRYTRPTDYLRKVWIKVSPDDEHQPGHTESGAAIYGFDSNLLLDYVSDTSANYDPANWPPGFTRCVVIYLAALVSQKIARTGADDIAGFYAKLDDAIAFAARTEAIRDVPVDIPAERSAVIRRALEMVGNVLGGDDQGGLDKLRWSMNRAWPTAIRYLLSQGAWDFAAKRAIFRSGVDGSSDIPQVDAPGLIEGFSTGTVPAETLPSPSEFSYSYTLPGDFVHKIWIKASPVHDLECAHQRLGDRMLTNNDPCVMEYVAEDDFTTNPANWPVTFTDAFAAYLALHTAPDYIVVGDGKGRSRVDYSNVRARLEDNYARRLSDAKIKDAIQQDIHSIPPGRFVRARLGSRATNWRRG